MSLAVFFGTFLNLNAMGGSDMNNDGWMIGFGVFVGVTLANILIYVIKQILKR